MKNKYSEWGPNVYDLVFFAEHHPNRVIYKCMRVSELVENCYGRLLHEQIGADTIVNNGVYFAKRNASLIYVRYTFITSCIYG